MGTKRFIITAILVGTMAMPSIAQDNILESDEISSFGVWTSIGAEKKITKKWGVELEGEFRTADELNEVSRYSIGISTDYKINSWLKVDAGYVFMRDFSREDKSLKWKEDEFTDDGALDFSKYELDIEEEYWKTRHRVNASLTGSVKLGNFKLSLRERVQYTFQTKKVITQTEYDVTKYSEEGWGWFYGDNLWQIDTENPKVKEDEKGGKHSFVLRSSLQVEYNIKGVPFEPYASVEMYNDLDGFDIKKMRYTIGGDYKINKKHSVGLYYRYQDFLGSDEGESTHILGVGYKFKF